MENYQLYRTNVLLGGQMKYDLILDSNGKDLIVKDFHITPISDKVPFNKYSSESLLNYSHKENIKTYYGKIREGFYEGYVDNTLDSFEPIIVKKGIQQLDTHDSTFEMGCRRRSYKLYNKQFEFLCPLWLENIGNKPLNFQFELYGSIDSKTPIVTKNLILKSVESTGNLKDVSFHNKFVHYINEFFEYQGIKKGNDDVMSIYLDNNTSRISGFDVKTGLRKIIDLPSIKQNLLSRERPLMEFNNLIINEFPKNHLISHQLYNFNLCFNFGDLFHSKMLSQLMGESFCIRLKVGIGENSEGEMFELRDFFTNYEYIPKKEVGIDYKISLKRNVNKDAYLSIENMKSDTLKNPNVLNYLKDNKCVDLVLKNKVNQQIIYWSLFDNNDYIFNLYEGFSGFHKNNEDIIYHVGAYDDAPDLTQSSYSEHANNNGWLNIVKLSLDSDLTEIENERSIAEGLCRNLNGDFLKSVSSLFGEKWNKKIKYNYNKDRKIYSCVLDISELKSNEEILKSCVAEINQKYPNIRIGFIDKQDESKEEIQIEKGIILVGEDFVYFLTCDNTEITFSKIINYNGWNENNEPKTFETLRTIMQSADYASNPPLLFTDSTLDVYKADSPYPKTDEISYLKNNKETGTKISRYYGKIKPTFVEENHDINFNYLYYKPNIEIGSVEYINYMIMRKTKYQPTFPSIGFYPYKNCDIIDYVLHDDTDDDKEKHILHKAVLSQQEYSWFNDDKYYILTPYLEVNLHSEIKNGKYTELKDLVKNYIQKYYKLTDNQQDLLNYINSLYEFESSFDYKELHNIVDYIYKVKITLK